MSLYKCSVRRYPERQLVYWFQSAQPHLAHIIINVCPTQEILLLSFILCQTQVKTHIVQQNRSPIESRINKLIIQNWNYEHNSTTHKLHGLTL